jgi:SAM-dependent methyltransferase
MGVGYKNLLRLAWLFERGLVPARGSVLELGSQNITAAEYEEQFERIVEAMRGRAGQEGMIDRAAVRGLADGGKMSSFLEMCGCEYHALDIFEDDKVTLYDLNLHDLPEAFKNHFDLVTNFGTTEHVFDQVRCFRTMHDAAKAGGVLYTDVPMGGYLYHGYFLYTPLFFKHLALANDYEVIFDYYGVSSIPTGTPSEMLRGGYASDDYRDACVEFAFRKVVNAPFRLPLEIGTSLGITDKVWNGAPPYRVIKGAAEARALEQGKQNSAPPDPLAELAASIAGLRGQVEQLRSEVKELGGEVKSHRQAADAKIADLEGKILQVSTELRSFKSYFDFARPLARLLARASRGTSAHDARA